MDNKIKFIEKAIKKHGNKFDYSKVEYIDSVTPIEIICPIHGSFFQKPANHIRGHNCPLCSNIERSNVNKLTNEQFIEKARKVHGDKYDYSKVNYVNANTKVCIVCPEHGEFWQLPSAHLNSQSCPKCKGRGLNKEELINKFKEVHGDKYDYSKVDFTKMKDKVCIVCPEHGEFWQTPQKHLSGQGCPKCKIKNKTLTKEQFIIKANTIHDNKYGYENVVYNSNLDKIIITCPIHGNFEQRALNHLQGCGCPKCSNNNSKPENEIYSFINELLGENIKEKDKTIISPLELDVYIPSFKMAIEFNGLRWHSEQFGKDKNYHLNKTNLCERQGIRLIHIFEDEWINKQEIVKSRLRNILNVNDDKIFARKCALKEVSYKESKTFLDENHIQGNVRCNYAYGLYYNDELVSLMTFGKLRKNLGSSNEDGKYELLRFCNKLNTTVVGGASKLLKHFVDEIKPYEIISYCDKRWSNGELYEKLGFVHTHDSKPNYFYVIGNKRINRFACRKDVLVKKYECPIEMSEHQFMLSKGHYRIYDCGTKVYKMKLSFEK